VLQRITVCCSMLQCVAVYCSLLQYIAVCISVLQCVAVYCSVLQYVAVSCNVLQFPNFYCCSCSCCCCYYCHTEMTSMVTRATAQSRRGRCVAVCCSVMQCVAVPQCVAACCSVLLHSRLGRCVLLQSICNTLQHTATHYNLPQHISTRKIVVFCRPAYFVFANLY